MKIFLILMALVVLGMIAAGVYYIPKLAQPAPHVWLSAKVDSGDLTVVATATGSVEPTSTIKVGSLVSGKVKEVRVAQDQPVKSGDVLAILDTEIMENERKDKEILLRQTKSNLLSLEIEAINLDLKEERLKQTILRDTIIAARTKASYQLAEKTLERYSEMVKKNATSISEYEIKELEKQNAEREMQLKVIETKTLETDLKEIDASRKAVKAKVQQTELSIEQADEALKKATTNLGYAQILSPIDGVVLEKTVDVGQTLAAQFQAPDLFKIAADLKRVNITANIDEVDISKIRIGQPVRFEVDSYRGDKFTGIVKTVHLKFEGKSNLIAYPVVIEAENPPTADAPLGKLLPGMSAFLEFDVEKKKGITRIPSGALSFTPPPDVLALLAVSEAKRVATEKKAKAADADKEPAKEDAEKPKLKGTPAVVYTKNADGSLKQIKVRVGSTDGKFYELLSGELKPGDEIVTGLQNAGINTAVIDLD